jgi:hypothetical protein
MCIVVCLTLYPIYLNSQLSPSPNMQIFWRFIVHFPFSRIWISLIFFFFKIFWVGGRGGGGGGLSWHVKNTPLHRLVRGWKVGGKYKARVGPDWLDLACPCSTALSTLSTYLFQTGVCFKASNLMMTWLRGLLTHGSKHGTILFTILAQLVLKLFPPPFFSLPLSLSLSSSIFLSY